VKKRYNTRLSKRLDGQVALILDINNDADARNAARVYATNIRKVNAKMAQEIEQAATCKGHENGGKWVCCPRAGEYNGFDSGPTIFTCPNHCSCHD
jgi:hypothetical protein